MSPACETLTVYRLDGFQVGRNVFWILLNWFYFFARLLQNPCIRLSLDVKLKLKNVYLCFNEVLVGNRYTEVKNKFHFRNYFKKMNIVFPGCKQLPLYTRGGAHWSRPLLVFCQKERPFSQSLRRYFPWSRIHERTISLMFLDIILRDLRQEYFVYNVYITNQYQTTFAQ